MGCKERGILGWWISRGIFAVYGATGHRSIQSYENLLQAYLSNPVQSASSMPEASSHNFTQVCLKEVCLKQFTQVCLKQTSSECILPFKAMRAYYGTSSVSKS